MGQNNSKHISVTLTPTEARCIVWHLESARRRGVDDETERGTAKIKQALKEQDAPLLAEVRT